MVSMVHVKVIGLILVLIVLNMFDSCSSCVMDRYYSYYVKNCTNDTLLIDVSGVDTLRDWKYWNEQVQDIDLSIDTKENMEFYKATIGTIALPDSVITVCPDIFRLDDTCYLYTIKLNVANSYSMDEIRKQKIYGKKSVIKKDFKNRLFEYR